MKALATVLLFLASALAQRITPETIAPGGPNPWRDVTHPNYGAKCDGVSDDTAAIQKALHDANAPTGGGTVLLPRTGKPCLVSTLNMDNMNNVTVQSGFNWSPQGGNAPQATLQFTGTCASGACLSMKSTADVHFRGVQLSFPNATTGPMIDLSHADGGGDSIRIGFHGVGFLGPGLTVGPIVLDQNTDFVSFDGWTQFNNASVFVEGPVNNAALYTDTTVFENVVFENPGTAAIQNASVAWTISGSSFALVNGTTCAAALQYVNGFTNQQNLTIAGTTFLFPAASCGSATTVLSLPSADANFGAAVLQGNLVAGPTNPANLNFLAVGDNQSVHASGNVLNYLNTVYTVGTGVTVDIGPSKYNVISTLLAGTPAGGRYVDNSGKTFFLGTVGLVNSLWFSTQASISSGFGTGASVTLANGSAAMVVNVGSGGSASSGVLTLPAAANGWNCSVNDITAAAAHVAYNTRQTASTSTTVTLENQTTSTGAAVAWAENDLLRLNCSAY